MQNEYKKYLPKWFEENAQLDLVLSDDIDSLASCALLKRKKNWDIQYFYDFKNTYVNSDSSPMNEKCYVDVAVRSGKAFDNHVSKFSRDDRSANPEMINLNNFISNDNYTSKYAGSTLLTLWSLFSFPIPKTEEGKMILLAIDSAYKGHYSEQFADVQKKYLTEILDLNELYDVIQRHTKEDFERIIDEYKLNSEIYVDENNALQTDLDLGRIGLLLGLSLYLPDNRFQLCSTYKVKEMTVPAWLYDAQQLNEDGLFSLAFTYKDSVRYSTATV
jgi:hypothetical protein